MNRPLLLPNELRERAFTRREALALGLTSRILDSYRFLRIFPEVYILRGVVLDHIGWIKAAMLATPEDAYVSHVTRIQLLGIDLGRRRPFHFLIGRDLHLDIAGIRLHRTRKMPEHSERVLSVEAAFAGSGAYAPLLHLVMIGDWLLRDGHTTVEKLAAEVRSAPARPGAATARRAIPMLRVAAESPKESELRCIIVGAGLPEPQSNVDVADAQGWIGRVDLLLPEWKIVLEYEGRQHADSIAQWNKDLRRYERLTRAGYVVIRVTHEMLQRPRQLVERIHQILVERGYRRRPPNFSRAWTLLFA